MKWFSKGLLSQPMIARMGDWLWPSWRKPWDPEAPGIPGRTSWRRAGRRTPFREDGARILVSIAPAQIERARAVATAHGVPLTPIGITGGEKAIVEGHFDLELFDDSVRMGWRI